MALDFSPVPAIVRHLLFDCFAEFATARNTAVSAAAAFNPCLLATVSPVGAQSAVRWALA